MSQRVIQMIKNHNTQLALIPATSRAPLTALVLGSDDNFEMERQLKENVTRARFYGTNFDNPASEILFKGRLNGTKIQKHIQVAMNDYGRTVECE